MMASVEIPLAFSNARSFAAGIYKAERRGRNELMAVFPYEVFRNRIERQVLGRVRPIGAQVLQQPCTASQMHRLPSFHPT